VPETIGVFIVARALGTPEHQALKAALERHPDVTVLGVACGGREAADEVPAAQPDIVLVDRDLPDGDGLRAAAVLTEVAPWASIIMLTAATDPELLLQAGKSGVRECLVTPVSDAQLVGTIRHVYHLDAGRRQGAAAWAGRPQRPGGRLYSFFGPKGGLGTTTLACNVAIALKQATHQRVALFDCNLPFGDVEVMLNVPMGSTIVDLLPHVNDLGPGTLDRVLVPHASGVQVLLAPRSPEKAELIRIEHVRAVVRALRRAFDYVVVDTWPTFEDRVFHVLESSDAVVIPTTLETAVVKNTRLLLDLLGEAAFPLERTALVLNRAGSRIGNDAHEVERLLGRTFTAEIVSDWRLATRAANKGEPFVVTHPNERLSQTVAGLAYALAELKAPAPAPERSHRSMGLLRNLFGPSKFRTRETASIG
jgi:pilus assembly protein CpaE